MRIPVAEALGIRFEAKFEASLSVSEVSEMFIRIKTVKSGNKEYQYRQCVEGKYKDGRIRQKALMTLGPADSIGRSRVDEIGSALRGLTDKIDVL